MAFSNSKITFVSHTTNATKPEVQINTALSLNSISPFYSTTTVKTTQQNTAPSITSQQYTSKQLPPLGLSQINNPRTPRRMYPPPGAAPSLVIA